VFALDTNLCTGSPGAASVPRFSGTMSNLLTTDQAAERCNLSPRTLEKFRVVGGGPIFVRLRGSVRYRLEDLDAWVADNRHRTTSDDHDPKRPQGGSAEPPAS